MPRIQCLTGPTKTRIGGRTARDYEFTDDGKGRAVAFVEDERHIECLLGNPVYEVLAEETAAPAVKPKPVPRPKVDAA